MKYKEPIQKLQIYGLLVEISEMESSISAQLLLRYAEKVFKRS